MATTRETVVIADYDYGDVNIERAIIEKAGFELIAAQCKTEQEVIEVAHELSKSPNAKVIVLGDKTGLPIILGDK